LIDASTKEEQQLILGNDVLVSDNLTSLIPISQISNFNDTIQVEATFSISENDREQILAFAHKQYPKYQFDLRSKEIRYARRVSFQASNVKETKRIWWIALFVRERKKGTKFHDMVVDDKWRAIVGFISSSLIPHILYFPTFLFDFPQEIFESDCHLQGTSKTVNKYYLDILQDILCSVDQQATLQEHVFSRLASNESNQKRAAEQMLLKMGTVLTKHFFELWDKIFAKHADISRKIIIGCDKKMLEDQPERLFLYFKIAEDTNEYFIPERSLGFRWFFSFLLFTELRGYRQNDKKVLFLLDEPASNLHSVAQQKLLKSFENTVKTGNKILYTTHSHHLIEPNWLECLFICRNELINYEDEGDIVSYSPNKAKITVTPYRQFVNNSPDKITYFQPILDALKYVPSRLENIPNAVIMEGKTDHYFLNYFNRVFFKNKFTSFCIIPGVGCTQIDHVVRLYLGWGRPFLVMLDGDDEGKKSLQKYRNDYLLSGKQAQVLSDIDPTFAKIEKLISEEDKAKFGLIKKSQVDAFILEKLAQNSVTDFSEKTISNFKKVLEYFDAYFKSFSV